MTGELATVDDTNPYRFCKQAGEVRLARPWHKVCGYCSRPLPLTENNELASIAVLFILLGIAFLAKPRPLKYPVREVRYVRKNPYRGWYVTTEKNKRR